MDQVPKGCYGAHVAAHRCIHLGRSAHYRPYHWIPDNGRMDSTYPEIHNSYCCNRHRFSCCSNNNTLYHKWRSYSHVCNMVSLRCHKESDLRADQHYTGKGVYNQVGYSIMIYFCDCNANSKLKIISPIYFGSIFMENSFGGLGVACWPLVPKFACSNPAEAIEFLGRKKILSTPSFGGEVKLSVPCRRFAACKRPLSLCGSRNLGKITTGYLSRPQFHLSLLGFSRRCVPRHLAKQWQTTTKNLPRMHCARIISVTWLGSGSCQTWP